MNNLPGGNNLQQHAFDVAALLINANVPPPPPPPVLMRQRRVFPGDHIIVGPGGVEVQPAVPPVEPPPPVDD